MKKERNSQKRKLATITVRAPAAVHTLLSTRDKENVPKNMVLAQGTDFKYIFTWWQKFSESKCGQHNMLAIMA